MMPFIAMNPLINLRQRVADPTRPPLVIVPVTLADPAVVEIAGFAGAEAVLLDAEHGMIGPETLRSMLAHARSAGVAAVYRPRSFDAAACRQALDAGAAGIHVSHVDSEDEAEAVVRACRYAPLGQREMSLGRAIDYDIRNLAPYVRQANDSQLLVVMIESPEGVANAEKIAAVPGIDVIHIGMADLSHAMGLTGDYHHPDVYAAIERVLRAARAHGVSVGIPTADPERAAYWAAKGVRYFEADAPDYTLRQVYASQLAALAGAFHGKPGSPMP
jgi:2-keto-3-deoxy-L-rhamnonate aldolase RhmA